MIYKYLYR